MKPIAGWIRTSTALEKSVRPPCRKQEAQEEEEEEASVVLKRRVEENERRKGDPYKRRKKAGGRGRCGVQSRQYWCALALSDACWR